MDIKCKRAYDEATPADGVRVLVDRLWPRGVSKSRAAIDLWMKEVAPSTELRRSWHADADGHSDAHFAAFAAAYRAELAEGEQAAALAELVSIARSNTRVTLVYGAKDPVHNHVVVLRKALLAGV